MEFLGICVVLIAMRTQVWMRGLEYRTGRLSLVKSRSGILAAGGIGVAGVCLCGEGFGMLCGGDPLGQYYFRCAVHGFIQLVSWLVLTSFTGVQKESLAEVVMCVLMVVGTTVGWMAAPSVKFFGSMKVAIWLPFVVLALVVQYRLTMQQHILRESKFVQQYGQEALRRVIVPVNNSMALGVIAQFCMICWVFPAILSFDAQVVWFTADVAVAVGGVLPIFREANVVHWALLHEEVRGLEFSNLSAWGAWVLPGSCLCSGSQRILF